MDDELGAGPLAYGWVNVFADDCINPLVFGQPRA
jgi:hypothetical protein